MIESKALRAQFDEVMIPNYGPSNLIPDHAKGVYVYDVDGKEYLDLSGGIAVTSLGHCPDILIEEMKDQAMKLWHISNVHTTKEAIKLAELLTNLTFADRVFFCNSGAEANEAALKLARKYCSGKFGEKKHKIISFDRSFHGRTFFTVCVGGQPKYYEGFGPIPEGIIHLPYNDEKALEEAMDHDVSAIIIEPVQGEGGIYGATSSFLKKVRQVCDQYDAVMILDEIQTGVGRSGHLYSYEEFGIIPDILTSAKGIAGGFPLAAVLAKDHIAKGFKVGDHGSTYGGNPMGCRLAFKVLEIVSQPEFLQEVKEKSLFFREKLSLIAQKFPYFEEVRGNGLLLGLGLKGEWKGKAKNFTTAGLEDGVIILQAGPETLRFAPALNISYSEMEEGIIRFEAALTKMVNRS